MKLIIAVIALTFISGASPHPAPLTRTQVLECEVDSLMRTANNWKHERNNDWATYYHIKQRTIPMLCRVDTLLCFK